MGSATVFRLRALGMQARGQAVQQPPGDVERLAVALGGGIDCCVEVRVYSSMSDLRDQWSASAKAPAKQATASASTAVMTVIRGLGKADWKLMPTASGSGRVAAIGAAR